MTTVQIPYMCSKCRHQFNVTMKLGEPLITRTCPKCGDAAIAPPL